MGLPRTIYSRNKPYYRYATYTSYAKARKIGLYYKKKNKCKYIISAYDSGYWFPEKRYALYLDKVVSLV